jgi:hypothetical protein
VSGGLIELELEPELASFVASVAAPFARITVNAIVFPAILVQICWRGDTSRLSVGHQNKRMRNAKRVILPF